MGYFEYERGYRPPSYTLAIVALLLGLVAAVPCFITSAPACLGALIVGAIARRNVMADPQRYAGHGIATFGFGIGCLAFVFWGLMVFIDVGMLTRYFHHDPEPVHLTRAEIIAAREADEAKVKRILQVLIPMADKDPRGEYPKRLAASYPEINDPGKYVATLSGAKPMAAPDNPKDWESYQNVLDTHSDFVYAGADLKQVATNDRNLIVIYSKDVYSGEGRVIGFADAHVEWVEAADLSGVLALSNRHRELLKLQIFALDGWIPGTKVEVAPRVDRPANGGVPAPPPENLHLVFASLDEALQYVQTGKPEEKRTAMDYVMKEKPAPAAHDKVMPVMRLMLADFAYHADALKVYSTWATRDDLPAIRTLFGPLQLNAIGADPADARPMLKLLGKFADEDSIPAIIKFLPNGTLRDDAVAALIAIGKASEEPVQPLVDDANADVAKAALKILAEVGTEKSVLSFHRGLYSKTLDVPKAAEEGLGQLAARLKLKPEQYLYELLNHYTIEAPVGFLPDNTFSKPNARQWARQLPGRSVKSLYTVTVKMVGKDYQITAPDGAPTMNAGTITFKQVEVQTGTAQHAAHLQALDGDYLIDLVGVLDNSDTLADRNMTTAVTKIKAKAP